MTHRRLQQRTGIWLAIACLSSLGLTAQTLQYEPYIQPGDAGPLGATDQMVVAWRTTETTPGTGYTVNYGARTSYGQCVTAVGRVVDNYLAHHARRRFHG